MTDFANNVNIQGANGPTINDIALLSFKDLGDASNNALIGLAGTVGAGSGSVGDLRIATGNNVERLRISKSGNIGIGTQNPLAKLSIGDGSLTDPLVPAQINAPASSEAWYGINKGGNKGLLLGYSNAGPIFGTAGIIRMITTDPLQFVVNGATTAMTIDSAGRVGIGTSIPKTSLNIPEQGLQIGTSSLAYNNFHMVSDTNGGLRGFRLYKGDYGAGTHLLTILANGSVGIGATNPGYNLDLDGGTIGYGASNSRTEYRTNAGLQGNAGAQSGFFQNDGVVVINYPAGASGWWHLIDVRHSNPANNYALQIAGSFFNQDLYFRKTNNNPSTAWNKFIYQNSVGNVGIGTTTPGAKLEVNLQNSQGWGGPLEALRINSPDNRYWIDLFTHVVAGGNVGYSFRTRNEAGAVAYVLTMDTFGKVGIGTTSPAANLDVAGGGKLNQVAIGSAPFGALPYPYESIQLPAWANLRINFGSTETAIFTNAGDVQFSGNLGTHGYSPNPRTSGWGGGIHTWDVEAEGTMWSWHGYESGPRDLAENYSSDMDIEPGDVVCLDQAKDRIIISEKPNDCLVLGVVSTAPGFLLNAKRSAESEKVFPVALCGRVPCKVVDENGSIKRGDLLTSSSTPGHAMKASPIKIRGEELFRPGTIIGKALDTLESGKGIIDIFVFSS